MGMGGCWGWRGRIGKVENSRGERVDELGPLPDLACASKGRKVVILLDANASSNPKVQQARRALHIRLIKQGAEVSIAELTATGVNGPDDFIGIAGDDAMAAVLDNARTKSDGEQTPRHNAIEGQIMARSRARSLLLELGSDIEFFHTSDRDAFASVNVDGHLETFSVASEEFSCVLLHRYYRFTSSVPPKQALEDVIRIFKTRASSTALSRRSSCGSLNTTEKYLDLADPVWNAVEISVAGWRVVANPPVKFVRSRGMRPLPKPVAGGHVNQLRPFLNIADESMAACGLDSRPTAAASISDLAPER